MREKNKKINLLEKQLNAKQKWSFQEVETMPANKAEDNAPMITPLNKPKMTYRMFLYFFIAIAGLAGLAWTS